MAGRTQGMDEVFQYLERIRPRGNAAPAGLTTIWLVNLPRAVWRLQEPIYGVAQNAKNYLRIITASAAAAQRTHQGMLNQFVTVVLRPSNEIAYFTPSYCLKIHKKIFSSENYQNFADFLTDGNSVGLLGMSMSIPNNGGSMNFIFGSTLSFPEMRELRMLFSDEGTTEAGFRSNERFVPFLQLILHGAIGLEKVLFSYCQNRFIPTQLQGLTFPASLTSLYLECELTSQQLDRLTARPLPNLRNFGVTISKHNFRNNLLLRVLDRFKETLERLYLYGIKFDQSCTPRPKKHVSYFQFPVMASLKLFVITSIHGELVYGLKTPLQTFLPQLKHVWLKHQTRQMFSKWTRNSCFPSVTNLGVGLVKKHVPIESLRHDSNISEVRMEFLQRAFPNVTVLNLNVADNLSGLVCLFSGRLRLTELKLEVKKNELPSYSNIWDCLLIGISTDDRMQRQRLSENPRLVNNLNIDPNMPSIKKFTALRFLALSASFLPALEQQDSLISDAAFRFAFLQMPTLNELQLVGMFRPTRWATRLWQSRHRTITYTASDNAHDRHI